MNKRIEKLAEQAEQYADDTFNSDPVKYDTPGQMKVWQELMQEKFAELIVRECLGCCEQVISDPVPESVDTWLNGGEQCIQEIKEHFGLDMSVADKKQLIKDLLGVKK